MNDKDREEWFGANALLIIATGGCIISMLVFAEAFDPFVLTIGHIIWIVASASLGIGSVWLFAHAARVQCRIDKKYGL